jgi:hypothetical protein
LGRNDRFPRRTSGSGELQTCSRAHTAANRTSSTDPWPASATGASSGSRACAGSVPGSRRGRGRAPSPASQGGPSSGGRHEQVPRRPSHHRIYMSRPLVHCSRPRSAGWRLALLGQPIAALMSSSPPASLAGPSSDGRPEQARRRPGHCRIYDPRAAARYAAATRAPVHHRRGGGTMADDGAELGRPTGAVGGVRRGETERVRDGSSAVEPARRGPRPTGELGQGASSSWLAPGGEAQRRLEKDLGSSAGSARAGARGVCVHATAALPWRRYAQKILRLD